MVKTYEKLSIKELQHQIKLLNAELVRRKAIETASNKINKILDESGLLIDDIKSNEVSPRRLKVNKSNRKTTQSKLKKRTVSPKYHNGNHELFWTGRGKEPNWVKDICKKKNISLATFKSSEMFSVKSSDVSKD